MMVELGVSMPKTGPAAAFSGRRWWRRVIMGGIAGATVRADGFESSSVVVIVYDRPVCLDVERHLDGSVAAVLRMQLPEKS